MRWDVEVTDEFGAWWNALSEAEQEALDAGTVWWDGELFSGHPNWQRLLAYAKPALSAEEPPVW